MRRSLSELQRFILRRATEQHCLYYAEILAAYFGWQPVGPWAALHRHAGELANPGGQRFSRDAIGRARYHRTHVVLTRACRRLVARGFVAYWHGTQHQWAAVAITAAGRAALAAEAAPAVAGRPPRAERTCATCGHPFSARRGARTCSPACRQRAYRQRQHTPQEVSQP
jgi:hypothetical protein